MALLRGRSLLVYALAISGLLALMGGVVSAGNGIQSKPLAGALQVKRSTCKGSPKGVWKLRRVCHHARVAGKGGKRRPDKQYDPAPSAEPGSSPTDSAGSTGSTPGPDATSGPETSPGADPDEPDPVPVGTTPEPETPEPAPAPEGPPEPAPGPAEPAPEPQPQPDPEPGPSPSPEPAPEEEPIPSGTPPPAEPGPAPSPTPSPTPSGSIYWGAWVGGHLTGTEAPWDMGAVARLEQQADKNLSVVNFSAPFANCSSGGCSFYDFPAAEFNKIRAHGAIPFYSWGSQSIPAPYGVSQPNFELSDVIAGTYDSYIRQFATAAENWGKPFFLRFNWEMNGGWFNWSEGTNGNQAGEYVAAWRHVHDIFTDVGATNATWVWCPNVDPDNAFQDLGELYPGDAYVDWTGLDGYNWGTNPARPDKWRSFDALYRETYDEITQQIAPGKPLVVSEIGSTEFGGSKAAWIEDMLATVPAEYPKIRGLLWFEKYDDGMDWPLETSPEAIAAFAAGIQNPVYLGNTFGALSGGAIQAAN